MHASTGMVGLSKLKFSTSYSSFVVKYEKYSVIKSVPDIAMAAALRSLRDLVGGPGSCGDALVVITNVLGRPSTTSDRFIFEFVDRSFHNYSVQASV